MKLRITLTAAIAVCLAASLAAQSVENLPLSALFTKEEATRFKTLGAADQKAFLELFWARRDPTPATPANEYRQRIEALIQYADTNFKDDQVRGALTDRGKALLVYGEPKRALRSTPKATSGFDAMRDNAERVTVTWIYEGDEARSMFGTSPAQIVFADAMGRGEYRLVRPRWDVNKAQERAVAKTITQASLTAPPTFARSATPPAPAASAPAAAAMVTALTTDALKTAVAEFKAATKNPYDGKVYPAWGEYVTSQGQYFVPVGLYLPKATGVSGDVTYFGIVEDASGKSVLAFEEPATLLVSKDDFFVDKSLSLPAGKHRGYFGVAQNGKVVALTSADMELAGAIEKDAAGVSQLILSNNVFPLTVPQRSTDPYSFGGVRVVPKADRRFRTSDELWYFLELRNPGVAEPAAAADATVPVNGAAPVGMPKIQVKIDVTGKDTTGKTVKMSAPPSVVDAIEMKGVPGHYGIGNAIPLATFRPGDYTFTVKVIDTINKNSHTLTEKFTVVP